jgi:hypothetical protein
MPATIVEALHLFLHCQVVRHGVYPDGVVYGHPPLPLHLPLACQVVGLPRSFKWACRLPFPSSPARFNQQLMIEEAIPRLRSSGLLKQCTIF